MAPPSNVLSGTASTSSKASSTERPSSDSSRATTGSSSNRRERLAEKKVKLVEAEQRHEAAAGSSNLEADGRLMKRLSRRNLNRRRSREEPEEEEEEDPQHANEPSKRSSGLRIRLRRKEGAEARGQSQRRLRPLSPFKRTAPSRTSSVPANLTAPGSKRQQQKERREDQQLKQILQEDLSSLQIQKLLLDSIGPVSGAHDSAQAKGGKQNHQKKKTEGCSQTKLDSTLLSLPSTTPSAPSTPIKNKTSSKKKTSKKTTRPDAPSSAPAAARSSKSRAVVAAPFVPPAPVLDAPGVLIRSSSLKAVGKEEGDSTTNERRSKEKEDVAKKTKTTRDEPAERRDTATATTADLHSTNSPAMINSPASRANKARAIEGTLPLPDFKDDEDAESENSNHNNNDNVSISSHETNPNSDGDGNLQDEEDLMMNGISPIRQKHTDPNRPPRKEAFVPPEFISFSPMIHEEDWGMCEV